MDANYSVVSSGQNTSEVKDFGVNEENGKYSPASSKRKEQR